MPEPTERVLAETSSDAVEERTNPTSRRQFIRQAAQVAAGGAAVMALSKTQVAASPAPANSGPVIDISGIHSAWINGNRQNFLIEQDPGDPTLRGEFRGINNEFIGTINGTVQGYRQDAVRDQTQEMTISFSVTLPTDVPGQPKYHFEGWVGIRFDSGEILMAGRHFRNDFPGDFPWFTLSHVRV